jgi:hypothetical protein
MLSIISSYICYNLYSMLCEINNCENGQRPAHPYKGETYMHRSENSDIICNSLYLDRAAVARYCRIERGRSSTEHRTVQYLQLGSMLYIIDA